MAFYRYSTGLVLFSFLFLGISICAGEQPATDLQILYKNSLDNLEDFELVLAKYRGLVSTTRENPIAHESPSDYQKRLRKHEATLASFCADEYLLITSPICVRENWTQSIIELEYHIPLPFKYPQHVGRSPDRSPLEVSIQLTAEGLRRAMSFRNQLELSTVFRFSPKGFILIEAIRVSLFDEQLFFVGHQSPLIETYIKN